MNGYVVVLRTHRLDDPEFVNLYERLRTDCGEHRTYVMMDNTKGGWEASRGPLCAIDLPASLTLDNTFLVTDADCVAVNSIHDQGYRGGNTVVSWMFWHPETAFVLCHDWLRAKEKEGSCPSFEYVWFVEYDVRCAGSFHDALTICNEIKSDFMACGTSEGGDRLRFASEDPSWCWFPRLDGEIAKRVQHMDRVGSFFPMVRISTPMSEALKSEFGKSTGFSEVYTSTLAAVTPGLTAKAMPATVLGSFRYSPTITREKWTQIESLRKNPTVEPPLLYHPIK